MPHYSLYSASFVLVASIALGGCTTSELAYEAQQSMIVAADDPILPDKVDVTPTIFSLAEEMETQPQIAAAITAAATVPDPASASGPQIVASAPVAYAAMGGQVPAPILAATAVPTPAPVTAALAPAATKVAARSPELDALIARYADHHEIPVDLLRRVVKRESTFNPAARNGPYWGLMQILPQTARTMGYQGGPEGLLDAETNLKYAGRYLRGAYLTADGNHDLAVRYYSRGYYYDAKRKGLLEETGLGRDRRRIR